MIIRRSLRIAAGIAWAVLATGSVAVAAEPEVDVRVEPPGTVSETQPVRLIIEVRGTERPEVSVPTLPPLKNLSVVSGPNTASRFSWINGQASASTTLTYVLLPQGPGEAEIPSFKIRVGDRVRRSDAIRFQVRAARGGPPAPVPPGQKPDTGETEGKGEGEDSGLYLEASLAMSDAWVGQPVTYTVTLFTPVRIEGGDLTRLPDFSDFWVEDVKVDPRVEAYRTRIHGRRYLAYPLVRKILVPNRAGTFHIEPLVGRFEIRVRSGDPFRDLFDFGRSRSVIRKSNSPVLKVRQLPEAGRPPAFSGAVGSFKLTTSLDRKEAKVNDAVALKAVVEGEGFLRVAPAPKLTAPAGIKLFDPKTDASVSTKNGRMKSRKSWEWVLVPGVPGEVRVPAVEFSYFDPAGGKYRTLRSSPGMLLVRRGETTPGGSTARGEIRAQRKAIAFIKPLRGALRGPRAPVHRRGWFLFLLVLGPVLVPVVVTVGRRRERLLRDRGRMRARNALSRARKGLRAARRHAGKLDSGPFHEEVARCLVEYVADHFDRSPTGLTYEVADQLLASRGVDAELRGAYRRCLERCDFARFVPSSGGGEARREVLHEAEEIVAHLEKEL